MARKHRTPGAATRTSVQKSFRLDTTRDAALIAWLDRFAQEYKQSDVIRLALYHLAGIQTPPDLQNVLPPADAPRQLPLSEPAQPETADTSASEAFNAILAELAELRELVGVAATRDPVPVDAGGHQDQPPVGDAPGVRPSSGIDMSGPRRRKRPPRPATQPPPTLPEVDDPPFDPEATARIFVESVKGYGRKPPPG